VRRHRRPRRARRARPRGVRGGRPKATWGPSPGRLPREGVRRRQAAAPNAARDELPSCRGGSGPRHAEAAAGARPRRGPTVGARGLPRPTHTPSPERGAPSRPRASPRDANPAHRAHDLGSRDPSARGPSQRAKSFRAGALTETREKRAAGAPRGATRRTHPPCPESRPSRCRWCRWTPPPA
jgi:hypothetical protein